VRNPFSLCCHFYTGAQPLAEVHLKQGQSIAGVRRTANCHRRSLQPAQILDPVMAILQKPPPAFLFLQNDP
jgi:hypothetical protein